MKTIYEVDDFNKVLSFLEHHKTTNNDFHIFRIEDFAKKGVDILVPLHRQHFMDITLFVQIGDEHEVYFDGRQQNLTTATLQMVPPFKLISFNIPKEENIKLTKGYTILFSFDFLSIGLTKPDFLKDFDFFKITSESNHFNLSVEVMEKFVFLFEKMLYEYENNQNRSKQILQGYMWVMLNECKKVYDANQSEVANQIKTKHSQKLFESFQNLIADNIHNTYAVEDYADMLFITPNHLTQSIKEVSGKSPKAFINERRLVEAKCLLQYTNNSIAEVSHILNFSEPTHFNKFFKKETGITPLEFRLSN